MFFMSEPHLSNISKAVTVCDNYFLYDLVNP